MLMLKPTLVLNGKKYKIISQIGEGGFAYVYHVKGNPIKEYKQEDYAIKKMICQIDEQVDEAKKEIDIMLKIQHPNVLPLIDFTYYANKKGQQEVMLLLPLYHTSAQHVVDHGYGYPYCSFPDGLDLVKILRNCVDGLVAVHQAGFRHADLKPGNILLTEDNTAVLTDFGSCMPLVTNVTNRTEALEVQEKAQAFTTASYRSPELFDTPSNIIIDGKSDVWSFGCLMYCLMFSKTPFESQAEGLSTLSVLTGQFSYPADNIWPEDYIELINKCLTVDPSSRLTVEELQLRLKRISSPPIDLKIPAEKKEILTNQTTTNNSNPNTTNNNNNSNNLSNPAAVLKKSFFQLSDKFLKGTSSSNHSHSTMEGIGSDSFKDGSHHSRSQTPPRSNHTPSSVPNSQSPAPSFPRGISKEMDFADFESSPAMQLDGSHHPVEAANDNTRPDPSVNDAADNGKEIAKPEAAAEDVQKVNSTEDLFADDGDDAFADFESAPPVTTAAPGTAADPLTSKNEKSEEEFPRESEEFGDFSSGLERQPSQKAIQSIQATTTSSSTSSSSAPIPAPPSAVQLIKQIEIIDLHYLIINDLVMKRIIKEGNVFTMRLGGFPKKMMKKTNWLVLTPNGIILRKNNELNSKIHEIFTFHRPISANPSDTLSIGVNGVLICGASPISLFSGENDHTSSSSSSSSAPSTSGDHGDEMKLIEDLRHLTHEESNTKKDVWYKMVYRSSPLTFNGQPQQPHQQNKNQSPQVYRTKFSMGTKLEISFQDREEVNHWIDAMMTAYENCFDNIIPFTPTRR